MAGCCSMPKPPPSQTKVAGVQGCWGVPEPGYAVPKPHAPSWRATLARMQRCLQILANLGHGNACSTTGAVPPGIHLAWDKLHATSL